MRKKRLMSTILAAAMIVGTLTGCGQSTEAGSSQAPSSKESSSAVTESTAVAESSAEESTADEDSVRISEEVITFTVAGTGTNCSMEWEETIQFQEYENRLGIRLEAQEYDNEQWATKLPLLIAGDDLPDLIVGCSISQGDLEEWGDDGYLLDFSQYLDVMPNFSRILEEYPEYETKITTSSGAIYGFAQLNTWNDATLKPNLWISQTWLDNVGMDRPETLDELYEVLKAFKEQDANGNGDPNDEIPLGYDATGYYAMLPILWAHGIYSKNYTYHLQADEDGNVVLMDTTENYRDFLKYMNKLYSEGLINQDAYVISFAEQKTKAQEGLVGFCGTYGSLNNYDEMEWYMPNGFTTEKYSTEVVDVISSNVGDTYKIAASADTRHPEELAKFIDYLFTVEGALSTVNGYEGLSFDYLEVAGYGVADHSNYWDGYDSAESYRAQKAIVNAAFNIYQVNEGTIFDLLKNSATEDLLSDEIFEATGFNAVREVSMREDGLKVITVYPSVSYDSEVVDERTTLYTDINMYLQTMHVQFVTGETDIDAGWDAYLAELEKMGLERLMEIEQDAYDEYYSK